MEQKNYTEVLIGGIIYTLSGSEDELYLQKVAAYLNDKIAKIKKSRGYGHLSADYQALMIQLNVADDYFKAQEKAGALEAQKSSMERDTYSLKHELITTQLRLEGLQKDLENEKRRVQELEQQLEGWKAEQEQKKALQAAAAAVNVQRRH